MRYLITRSLLSSWLFMLDDRFPSDTRNPLDEFLTVLRREPTPTSEAAQKGIDFENLVTSIVCGQNTQPCEILDVELNASVIASMPITQHPWYKPASEIAKVIKGGALQCTARRNLQVDGVDFMAYGRLDALKGGTIFDIKFTGHYDVGKYFGSTQHPMYMFLVPEAMSFAYLVSNGSNVWIESYRRDETRDIATIVSQFLSWLRENDYDRLYFERWCAR